MDFKIPRCKKFSGYKPCVSYYDCLTNGCKYDLPENKIGEKILIISLDALGNVLDNTPVLPALKRKFPESTIYWLTLPNAKNILINNPYIDKLFLWDDESRMILRNLNFDFVMNADKSVYACSLANEIKAKTRYGFFLNSDGKIIPADENAIYSYKLGLDDQLKFRENQRTGIEILHEVFHLNYEKDECIFNFDENEKQFIQDFKNEINYDNRYTYVGFNTGCSELFPNKKMTIEQHIQLIGELLFYENIKIVLLGGREDTERNKTIFSNFPEFQDNKIFNSPTSMGIRKGACYMDVCDIVISGDSFGMHLAIALKKYVIAWFGLSCASEIELYGRGIKLIPEGLECSPCWKRVCPYNLECIQMIDIRKIREAVINYSFKKPSFSN
ncbi:MAG TPA: heptosyltransferase [Bacteroidetes bacterium]|nr:glycosyltransferase family 9 protein [Ignavibacteria bacterium]HCA41823.1 heptosyltransferase [Bacteroidota bacterium]HCN37104.1 heptosyltransferase [Bacteroidota bacterium]